MVSLLEKRPTLRRSLRLKNQNVREFLSEMLGTFMLAIFSLLAGAQYVLSNKLASDLLTVALSNGIGVTMGIYVAGGVSGGYINPAISLSMALVGKLPFRRLPVHIAGQMTGSFLAACITFGVYKEAFDAYDGGERSVTGDKETASIFATFPQQFLSIQAGFLDSIMCSGLLILTVQALTDRYNTQPQSGIVPLAVGTCFFGILISLGFNCGTPINPARDFGPRFFTFIAGWGSEVFSVRDYWWFWVPLLGPMVGSTLFTLIYYLLVAVHWHISEEDNSGNAGNEIEMSINATRVNGAVEPSHQPQGVSSETIEK